MQVNIKKLSQLASDNIEVNIFHFKHCKWDVILKGEADGVALQIKAEDVDFETALSEAIFKWEKATQTGVPELGSKLIAHEPPPREYPVNDDIPF